MIEEQGQVVALDGEYVWIQTMRQGACNTCQARAGCGQKILGKLSEGRASQVRVRNTLDLTVGDFVRIGIAERALLNASLMVYLLPIICMLVGAIFAQVFFKEADSVSALAGVAGLSIGLFIVKKLSFHFACNPAYHPQLLSKLG